jgi:hypothetical protein
MERNGASIDERDEQFLREWIQKHEIKTVLEFGPGMSTVLFGRLGLKVHSVELDPAYLAQAPRVPGCWLHSWSGNNIEALSELGLPPLFDLGFVDGPNGYSAPLARLLSALYCAERCRVLVLHDSNRPDEQLILQVLQRRGWKVAGERTTERGMVCLTR